MTNSEFKNIKAPNDSLGSPGTTQKSNVRPPRMGGQLLWGGILPVVIFTVIEDRYGAKAGVYATFVYAVGEILYEKIRLKKIEKMTLWFNGLILGLGSISILADDGIWFKLQPAIIEVIFFVMLFWSSRKGKPFLLALAEKQNPNLDERGREFLRAINFRLSFFFLGHAIVATWAAISWPTSYWAALKAVGLPITLVIYMLAEIVVLRRKVRAGKLR